MNPMPTTIDFRGNSQRVPPGMPGAVQKATAKFLGNRAALVEALGNDLWQLLRQAGHEIRLHALTHLDAYLELAETAIVKAGGNVHWARDAAEAQQILLDIAGRHRARLVVKSKSMATEEIGLNHALEGAGIRVLETDLGEYIVQLAGVGPAHIVVPAFYMSKEEIAALFREKLGVDAPAEAERLTQIARAKLREEFLAADLGVSGGNFLVAETGTIVTVTNEGNGRMCTTVPPVHVAVVGIDKIVPDWESLTVLLKLLARSATGQKLSCYTQFISGAPRTQEETGPKEMHVILLDNGRSRILESEATRKTLLCIRCGACLNICPVYNTVGGYTYGYPISGPTGAIFASQILGSKAAGALPFASTLCGACNDICPVKIPITDILLHLRHRVVEGDETESATAPYTMRLAAQAGSAALGATGLYTIGSRMLKIVQKPFVKDGWMANLPAPLHRWTSSRPFPAFAADFRQWWRGRRKA
ncbi:MAG TPA: LutB/LldF family L-lactate oxidation iron-sulfur protein [Candidatus Baltobacteraceae bacterium]|nr:LutB/LldF family L-lactate oxidation iron-sulfur protein [Candidatus Baltobacteraceae bacterium]